MKPNHTPFSSQAIRQSNFQPNFTSPNNYFSPQPSTNMYPNLQQKILQQQKNIIQQQQQLELLKAQLVQGAQQSPSTQVFQQGNTAPLSYHSSHTTPPPFILPHHQAFNHLFASQAIFNNPLSSPHPPTNATFKPFNHASSFGAYNNFNTWLSHFWNEISCLCTKNLRKKFENLKSTIETKYVLNYGCCSKFLFKYETESWNDVGIKGLPVVLTLIFIQNCNHTKKINVINKVYLINICSSAIWNDNEKNELKASKKVKMSSF